MNTQHTPGPWWLAAANETLYEAGVGNAPLTLPISKPDARLIAAAPELLKALDVMIAAYQGDLPVIDRKIALHNARAAIALARGES
jgi:hypothetical protein